MDINKIQMHTTGDITGVMRRIEGQIRKFEHEDVIMYWSVSKYLFDELKKHGELVEDIDGTYVYGKVSDGPLIDDETLKIIFK